MLDGKTTFPTSGRQSDAPEETKTAPAVRADADWDTMSDQEKLAVWNDWRQASDERSIPWLRQARRAFRYSEGDQVPDALQGKTETSEGRMLWLSLQGLRYLGHAHVGTLMAEKPEPHFEGTEWNDTDKAATASAIYDYTISQEHTRLHSIARRAAWNQRICGMGVIKEIQNKGERVDLGNGQSESGEVGSRNIDPEMLRIDPTSKPGDRTSLNFIIEIEPCLLRDVVAEYGDEFADVAKLKGKPFTTDFRDSFLKDYDKTASRKMGTKHDEFEADREKEQGNLDFNRMVIKEHFWYVQKKRVGKVFQEGEGGLYEHNSDMRPTDVYSLPSDQRGGYKVMYRTERIVRYGCKIDDIILGDGPSDFDDLPYGIFYGEKIEGYHLTVGEMYHLFHSVDLLNGLATNMIDNAIRSGSSGIWYEKSALSPAEKVRLSQEGHNPNFNLEIEDGYISRVHRAEQGQLSEGIYRLWTDIRTQIFDYLSGNPKIQTGQMPYQTSGRGILALGQRADMQQIGWQSNIEEGLTTLARLRWRNVQKTYTVNRLLRIKGTKDKQQGLQLVRVGQATQVQDAETEEVLLEDLSTAKFDLNVTIRPGINMSPDEKRELAMFLFNAGAVPLEYLISEDGLNVKNGEEWLAKRRESDEGFQLQQKVQAALKVQPGLMDFIEQPELLTEVLDAATPELTGLPMEAGALRVPASMMKGGGNGTPGGVMPPVPGRM